MIARQPDAGRSKTRDTLSEVLIGRGRVVLCQIACRDNQIALALRGVDGFQHGLIAFLCIDA